VRALLATALGRTDASEAVDALMDDLAHESRRVRAAAIAALGRLAQPRSAGELLAAAIAPDALESQLAREALGRIGEPGVLFVESRWDELDARQRQDAIGVLGAIDGARVDAFLAARLQDASPLVALAAARELGRRGDASGQALAQARLGSDDPVVARSAREALDVIEAATRPVDESEEQQR
jgi:HEAT repeat protein